MEILLNDAKDSFEITHEQQVAGRIHWTLQNNIMVMDGTFVDPILRGKSAGLLLLNEAAKYARENNFKMQAVCPYVVKMFERSADYDDIKL